MPAQNSTGPSQGFNYFYADVINPVVAPGLNAPVGSIYVYIQKIGPPLVYLHVAISPTAWTLLSGGGGPVTGDPNTIAYFNAGGNLADNLEAVFDGANNSIAFGKSTSAGGTMSTNGQPGSLAFGSAVSGGSIEVSGADSFAFGRAATNSVINSSGTGCIAGGYAVGGGNILSNGRGSVAQGYSDGASSVLFANLGPHVNAATFTFANARAGATVTSHGIGSLTFGSAVGSSELASGGTGCFAGGAVVDTGRILAQNAHGTPSFAFGYADSFGVITSSGASSVAFGMSIAAADPHTAGADLATIFGQSNVNNVFNCFVIGQYAAVTGNAGAWVGTDPAFIIGNGISGSPANAYELDKDGRITETGAKKLPVRVITGNDVLSARIDRAVILNDNTGSTFTLGLPVGEEGLYYKIGTAQANTSVWTLTPSGGNTVDLTTISSPTELIFSGNTWYQLA
jgi:hypothetical protein